MTEPPHPPATFMEKLSWRRAQLGSFHRSVAAIAGAGFVFRAVYAVVAKREFDSCGPPAAALCGDAFYYSSSANVFARGYGFENRLGGPGHFFQAADHPPLTTIVMAPANVLFWRHSPLAQRLLMCLLGAAVIVLAAFLARRLAGPAAGIATAAVAAVNANLWMNDVLVMSETVGAVTLLLLLHAAVRARARPTLAASAVLGAAVGLCGLARAELLLYGPLLVVPLLLGTAGVVWPRRVAAVAVAGLASLAVLAPWTVYNLGRFDEPVVISTNDGLTLVGANCDRVYGVGDPGGIGFWNLQCRFDADAAFGTGSRGDQSTQAREYRTVGLDYIRAHTDRLPHVLAVRAARAWGVYAPAEMVWLNQGEGRDSWASWTGYVQWWVLVPLAAAGAWVLRRRGQPVWPLLASVPVVTVTALAFYGIVRFRLPADVSATVLAGVALGHLAERRPGGRR